MCGDPRRTRANVAYQLNVSKWYLAYQVHRHQYSLIGSGELRKHENSRSGNIVVLRSNVSLHISPVTANTCEKVMFRDHGCLFALDYADLWYIVLDETGIRRALICPVEELMAWPRRTATILHLN